MTVPFEMPPLVLGASKGHGSDVRVLLPRLARVLGAALDTRVSVLVAEGYEEILERLLAGKVQVAWLPPLIHARATEQGARLAAVPQRGGWLTFRAALLVRKNTPVVGISRLRGLRAAWVDKSSASGYLFPRLELSMLGSPPERAFIAEDFFGSATKAGAAVVARQADLCACFVSDAAARDPVKAEEDVQRALGSLSSELRILHVTDPIPPDGFVLSAALTPQQQTRVSAALLALHESDGGKSILADLLQADKLVGVNEPLLRSLRSWVEAASARDGA